MFLAACSAAQQKHPQRMAGLLQLRRSALRMLIFYAAPSLLMGESGYRLRFDVIFRNTPAFLAPLCRATVERSETERFYCGSATASAGALFAATAAETSAAFALASFSATILRTSAPITPFMNSAALSGSLASST